MQFSIRSLPVRAVLKAILGGFQVVGLIAQQAPLVYALPQYKGGRSAQVDGLISGANKEIRVTGPRALVDWYSFSLDQGEVFTIHGNDRQTILNLVSGPDASTIAGMVKSGANFILANPNGISLLGSGSVVAPSVLFSTSVVDADDWLQSKGAFESWNNGWLSIPAAPGAAINVSGQILAKQVDGRGGSIRLQADQINVLGGQLIAQGAVAGGVIEIGAARQSGVLASSLSRSLLIDAGSLIDASALENGQGGLVVVGSQVNGGSTAIRGQLLSSGAGPSGTGGLIQVSGEALRLERGATLQASGPAGGGSVLVGGSWQNSDGLMPQSATTFVDAGVELIADASRFGSGGEVVVWSDIRNPEGWTIARGFFSAQGGPEGGDGGRIETSGYRLDLAGVDGSARAFDGVAGTWLIDPYNIIVDASAADPGGSGAGSWTLGNDTIIGSQEINRLLNNDNNVVLNTFGDGQGSQVGNITIDAPIQKNDGTANVTLSLVAANNIFVNAEINTSGDLVSGGLALDLQADNDNGVSNGSGDVWLSAPLGVGGSLLSVDVSAAEIYFNADRVLTSGAQSYSGDGFLRSDALLASSGSGSITLDSVDGTHALTIRNGSGDITLGAVGQKDPLTALLLRGDGRNYLEGDIAVSGDVDLLGDGRTRESGSPLFDVEGELICDIDGRCPPPTEVEAVRAIQALRQEVKEEVDPLPGLIQVVERVDGVFEAFVPEETSSSGGFGEPDYNFEQEDKPGKGSGSGRGSHPFSQGYFTYQGRTYYCDSNNGCFVPGTHGCANAQPQVSNKHCGSLVTPAPTSKPTPRVTPSPVTAPPPSPKPTLSPQVKQAICDQIPSQCAPLGVTPTPIQITGQTSAPFTVISTAPPATTVALPTPVPGKTVTGVGLVPTPQPSMTLAPTPRPQQLVPVLPTPKPMVPTPAAVMAPTPTPQPPATLAPTPLPNVNPGVVPGTGTSGLIPTPKPLLPTPQPAMTLAPTPRPQQLVPVLPTPKPAVTSGSSKPTAAPVRAQTPPPAQVPGANRVTRAPQLTPMPLAPGATTVDLGRVSDQGMDVRESIRPAELIPCRCNRLLNRYDYVLPSGRVVSYDLDEVPTVPETLMDRGQPVLLEPPPLSLRNRCELRPTQSPTR